MSVFSSESFDNHEQVLFCSDKDSGLKAIIAVHSTAIGPGVGGCRMWQYDCEEDAINDVLRLSRGMSYKNALANLGLGGAKAIIIGDSRSQKSPELLRAFGRFIDSLSGRFITAEDVGMSVEDMEHMATQTKWVAGLEHGAAASGDPSPFTAHGVFCGIRASLRHVNGNDDVTGIRVAVQGLGHVGYHLCRELHEAGAELTVTDINAESVARVVDEFGAKAVPVEAIIAQDVDVFSPCALGAVIYDETIPQLRAKIVAGAANNQLAEARHGEALRERGILYAPDYLINAGGIMNVANEVKGVPITTETSMTSVEVIYGALLEIFAKAELEDRPTSEIADEIAQARIEAAKAAGGWHIAA
jgi:leucine dehydrogenase